jgi:nitrate/TMAO reductase-like tetraheme cytochrome c subunit
MPDQSRSPDSGTTAGTDQPMPPQNPAGARWRLFTYRWLKRFGVSAIVLIVLSGLMLVWADHKTTQPEFCGSCHIMEPYYESWHADLHGGKLEVACVECHYAPGERTTVKSRLRGLSQVASYVSGRYGTARPRAHVDNLSCLTSKCHGDMQFMDKEISLGTVKFTHAKHLRYGDDKRAATRKDLEDLAGFLQEAVGMKRFEELEEVARQAVPAVQRLDRMTRLIDDWKAKVEPLQLSKFSQLQHRQVRTDQLSDLQCTNCHSYVSPITQPEGQKPLRQPLGNSSAHHFTVKTTACYTCHFNNESFNTGTASCLLCHTLPTKEIVVHKELTPADSAKLKSPELSKQPTRMDHKMILARKVDCIACHADVATENSTVTRRDCERCHDRPAYFQKWKEPFSLTLVKEYHALHVPEQRAKCLDCHSEIHHQLVRGPSETGQPAFLSSAMTNCTHCHPNQHVEQVQLLSGMGGVGVTKSDPNLMFGSRTNCFGCHSDHTAKGNGAVVSKATVSGCIACHGDRHAKTFDKWKQGLEIVLVDANEAYDKARKMLDKAKDIDPESRNKATDLLNSAQADLRLVKRGNGVHNVTYSIELLDSVTRRCQQAMGIISKATKPKS